VHGEKTEDNYKMTEINNELILTIKRKPNWLILPLAGLWTLGWIGMIGTIIYGLATDPDKLDGELILFMTFFFLAGLFVLKIFLWHLRGQEKITVNSKELIIEKIGTILTIPRKYEIEQIDYISNTERPTTPKWIKFWGLGGGQIEFVYLGQTKYFGQTLTVIEATKIIEKIKGRLKTTTRQQTI
jgi:hypothetical protein